MEQKTTIQEEQNIIFLIMTCKKYRLKSNFQKNTWLLSIPTHIKYYHVFGDPLLTNEYLFNDNDNILYVKTEDDYCSLPKKVIKAYEAIYTRYNFKYILKTDDDQYLTNTHFLDILTNILENKEEIIHYGGKIINIKQPHYSCYNRIHKELPSTIIIKPTKYCNGRFYFLSIVSVKNILKNKKDIMNEYIEDYAIGYYLDDTLKTTMLYLNTDIHFRDIDNLTEWKLFIENNKTIL